MKRKTKRTLLVAAICLFFGAAVFAVAMAMNGWNFYLLETQKMQTTEYEFNESFSAITVNTDTTDLVFLPSQTETCKVVCVERERAPHVVSVQNQTLTIGAQDNRKWYEFFHISFRSPKITVYLPQSYYGSLAITQSTGDISLNEGLRFTTLTVKASTGNFSCRAAAEELSVSLSTGDITVSDTTAAVANLSVTTGKTKITNLACESLSLKASTGNALLTGVTCTALTAKATTGDMRLTDVVAAQSITLTLSTGDVTFTRCDAEELSVTTTTGSVTGSLRSGKNFVVQTDTGKKKVPQSVAGGKCEITTSTGNVILEIDAE